MKNYTLYLLLLVGLVISGCSKDDDVIGTIKADVEGLFIEDFGGERTTTVKLENVGSIEISSLPMGWSASTSNSGTPSVTVVAPPTDGEKIELTGKVVICGESLGGMTVYESIEVGKVEFVDLDSQMANSMVVNKPGAFYTFDPKGRGETISATAPAANGCRAEWYTRYSPIKYVQMLEDGRIGFYVNPDSDDRDDDSDTKDIIEGNAVVSALSAKGNVMWSWHIWITEREISEVDVNGVTFMDRNIGATMNSNASTSDLNKSYGLFYQWGRKDPFIYPSTYKGSGSSSFPFYDYNGTYLSFSAYNSSQLTGSIAYATLNPRFFLLGNAGSSYDWLYGNSDPSLWGEGGEKSIYDPSPRGWRVPSASELAQIGEPSAATLEQYSVELGGELFMAFGRRAYIDGSLQNYAPGDKFQPWSGYYWSRDAIKDDTKSSSMHFYLDQSSSEVVVDRAEPNYRANGMQIRCVKVE